MMTKPELQQHYQALWQQSLVKFEQQQFDTDPLLTAKDDSRYGVTLLARPSEQVKQQIQHHLAELMQLEPQQYYYPASDLHLNGLIADFLLFRFCFIADRYSGLCGISQTGDSGYRPVPSAFSGDHRIAFLCAGAGLF